MLNTKNDNKIDRNDMHQVISYMYVEKANIGGFIYPNPDNNQCAKLGQLRGYGGYIYNIGVKIHQNAKNYNEFSSEMKQIEKHIIEEITKLETPNN